MSSSEAHLVERFFAGTGRSYDRVVRQATLGLDERWKRRLLARIPPRPRAVLDLACGTGILTYRMLARWPGLRVVGVDVTEDYLRVARRKQATLGGDVTFLLGNAETTDVRALGPFDAIVSSYIPKYVDADRLLANVTPALRAGGGIVLHDFTYPAGHVPKAVWNAYIAVLDGVGPRIWPDWEKCFDTTLASLIRRTRWVQEVVDALPRHGYGPARVERLTFRAATVVSARKA